MDEPDTIYRELGVPSAINAAGTKTRIGGSLIRPEAADDMRRAANAFAHLSDLQARASELVSELTHAEAGFVTSGAGAGMVLSAAAVIAGNDYSVMARLPNTDGIANEIVMPRSHRIGYDHAFRAAGAEIVDIGTNDHHLGTGSTNVEPWEIEEAITDATVAVGYTEKPYTRPSLELVAEIAHDNDTPVIVDAAAELPPVTNFSRFIERGADLVVFSGGKAIRGPQTTGIVAGKRKLIQSIALQTLDMHVPREVWDPPSSLIDVDVSRGVPPQGIGRPFKVGKEEIVGLIRALELFLEEDQDEQRTRWVQRAEHITDCLGEIDGFDTEIPSDDESSIAPEVVVTLDESFLGLTAVDLARSLQNENPRIFVGTDDLQQAKITINLMCLADSEVDHVLNRLLRNANTGIDTAESNFVLSE